MSRSRGQPVGRVAVAEGTLMEWLRPWQPIDEYGRGFAAPLEDALAREVGPGHTLYGVPVETIDKHVACDDVLFHLLDGSGRVAVVHLTWTRTSPERPPCPNTRLFPSLEAWAEQGMRRDHEEYSGSTESRPDVE